MPKRPIVIVHGYSDRGESFKAWNDILISRMGYSASDVHVCSYRSLTNEITIKDIAEGFDRALRLQTTLRDGQPFDAMVHSTGMLVIRSWLVQYGAGGAAAPLRNLIALAPATFGSPLAHKGRSFIGSVFKGSKNLASPDFMEAGDEVLYGLELGSRFTWDLAHRDLFGDAPLYGPSRKTPYVFVFCGDKHYPFPMSLATGKDGTDGTVRWAGCPLNARKFTLDLTAERRKASAPRAKVEPTSGIDFDLIPIAGKHHGSIVSSPGEELVGMVQGALAVDSAPAFQRFMQAARRSTRKTAAGMTKYQQFVIRAVDERGDGIGDWNAQLFAGEQGKSSVREFATEVHPYARDKSFRCFHVNLDDVGDVAKKRLVLKVIASTGTAYVSYYGDKSETFAVAPGAPGATWDAQIELRNQVDDRTTLFYPFTTTLVELVLNREPTPLDYQRPNNVTWWI